MLRRLCLALRFYFRLHYSWHLAWHKAVRLDWRANPSTRLQFASVAATAESVPECGRGAKLHPRQGHEAGAGVAVHVVVPRERTRANALRHA